MIYIMEKLRQESTKEKCLETMTRNAKLLSFGADDITALSKFGSWSLSGLSDLSKCLKLYENLKTLDRQEKDFVRRKESALKKKDAIAFPNIWFRKLAKVDEVYFQERAPSVVSKEKSLKSLVEDFGTVINRSHTMALIQKEFGFKTLEELNMSFPGKFPEEKLDSFSGALIGKNYKNPKGEKLQKYCLSVLMDTEAAFKVTYKTVEDANYIDVSDLNKFDTVVFNVKRFKASLIKKMENLRKANSTVAIILLFAKQEEQQRASDLLKKCGEESLSGPMTKRICFEKDIPDVSDDYCENLIHGLVCSVGVYEAPLKDFNGALSNIDVVANQVSPPSSKLAFVNEEDLMISSIHSLYACEYIGEELAIDKFKRVLGEVTDFGDINEKDTDVKDDEASISKENGDVTLDNEISEFNPNACSSFVMTGERKVCYSQETCGGSSNRSDSGNDESDSSQSLNDEDAEEVPIDSSSKTDVSQGISKEKYRLFVKLLHKCWDKSGPGTETVDVDILKRFLSDQKESDPFDNNEVDLCLDQMVFENKVMIDGSIVYYKR